MDVNTRYRFNTQIVKPQKKKSRKNSLFVIGFLILNIGIIAYIAYTSFAGQGNVIQQSSDVFTTWTKNIKFLLLALLMPFVAVIAESLKYFLLVRHKTGVWNFRLSLRTVIMGKYYDNITPLSSGGQPFQIYYLNKDGVPLGTATSMPFISFFLGQVALVFISLFILIYLSIHSLGNVNATVKAFKIVAYIGTATSILIPAVIIGVSIWPKLTRKIADLVVKMMGKIRFIRHKERHANTIYRTLEDYQESMGQYKKSGFVLFLCFLLSFVYKIALFSTPFFIIKACGIDVSYFEIFALTVIITVSVSFIPTPGGSGAAELSFQAVFASALASVGSVYTFWGMLFWRFCVYFMFIILGIVELLILSLKHKRRKAYTFIPITEVLYQVPVIGLRFHHKDQTSTLIPLSAEEASCFLSDKVALHEIMPRAPMMLKANQDFSCLTEQSYLFLSQACVQRLIRNLDKTKLYGVSFVVARNQKLGPTMTVDTGKEKSPLDLPETIVSTVQFVDYYYPLVGQTAAITERYAEALIEHGYPTRVYVPKLKKKMGEYSADYPIVYSPSLRFPFTNYVWATPRFNVKLKQSLEPTSVLIFHAQTPFWMGRYALRMARRYDVPLVGSFRHLYYHRLKKPLKSRILARIIELYGLSLYKRCDAVFVPSEETGELLRRRGYRGSYTVVPDAYEPLNENDIRQWRQKARKIHKITSREFVVSCILHSQEEKDCMWQTLCTMEERHSANMRFLVYGFSFKERNALRRQKEFKKLKVQFLPHSEDTEAMIAASDLLFLPRKREGGFPYERQAARYRVPTLMFGIPADDVYRNYDNCYETANDPLVIEQLLQTIKKDVDERTRIGLRAWETLTSSYEQTMRNVEKEYLAVIRKYYESVRK